MDFYYRPRRPRGPEPKQPPQRPEPNQPPQRPPYGRPGDVDSPTQNDPPTGPPPNKTPRKPSKSPNSPSLYRVDPGAIRPCKYRYVYIWLENGRSFWAWLTYVGRNSVAGWRWNGYYWTYFGTDINNISDFECF